MAKGPKGFSEEEKAELKNKLCVECERSWALHGYKKTGVGELTAKIGISTGAFYLLYSSKEELFCETLERVQNRLKNGLVKILKEEGGKSGFYKSMVWHFREYEQAPFLYDFGSPDYLAFLNKLPKEHVENSKYDSEAFFESMVELAGLKLKVDKKKANAVLSTLLFTVTLRERLQYDHVEVFEFLLNSAMDDLFD